MHIIRSLSVTLLLLLLASCGTQIPSVRVTPTAPLSLRSLAQARGISIGTAVNIQALRSDPQYRETLSHEFNMVTPENSLKFASIHPSPNVYSFQDADTIVAFAKAHAMQVHGHNLVWSKYLPTWITQGNFSRAALTSILREHIMTVVSHYRGQVNIWDVVNEPVNDNGTLQDSVWLRDIGPDYIDLAFQWAHEANPKARLFYNDYNTEWYQKKSDAVYALLKGLLQRGVPISGVGLELHLIHGKSPNLQYLLANMKRLADLGLEVDFTETEVGTYDLPGTMEEKLATQAQIYRDILSVCLVVLSCKAFVIWGFTDRYSWLSQFTRHPEESLIFDTSYHPKPAYFALADVLSRKSTFSQ
jgi:endo-1,4-beta-xylanase